MTTASPLRRALVDLPVNTAGTPRSGQRSHKMQTGKKRPHSAIEESENEYEAPRQKTSVGRQPGRLNTTHPVLSTFELGILANDMKQMTSRTDHTRQYSPLTDTSTLKDERMRKEEDSESSATLTGGFEPDESMNSQQTAATEVTEGESRARIREVSTFTQPSFMS